MNHDSLHDRYAAQAPMRRAPWTRLLAMPLLIALARLTALTAFSILPLFALLFGAFHALCRTCLAVARRRWRLAVVEATLGALFVGALVAAVWAMLDVESVC